MVYAYDRASPARYPLVVPRRWRGDAGAGVLCRRGRRWCRSASAPICKLLARIAGGVLWIAAVLAALLSLDRLFQADFEDGSLDLIALSPLSLESTAFAKIAAHWLTTGFRSPLLSPLLGLLFGLPPQAYRRADAFAPHRHARGQRHRRGGREPHAFHSSRRTDPAADRAAAACARRDLRRRRGAGRARWIIERRALASGGVFAGGGCPAPVCMRGRRAAQSRRMSAMLAASPRKPRARPCSVTPTPNGSWTSAAPLLPWLGASAAVLVGRGSISRLRGAAGLPAGRHRQDHVHPCARRLDGDDGLWIDGAFRRCRPYLSSSTGGCGCQSRSASGRALHRTCAHHRLALGQADVGRMVGVGCAADLVPDPAVALSRLHRAVECDRG